MSKGRVCVTGGTGFLGSWMIMRLLEDGYSVNTTARIDPGKKRDITYLTNLPGASERLQIFSADLEKPETFIPAVQGCVGVFHMAHPMDFEEKETEHVKIKRVTSALRGILQACVDAKTVRRVVYTSSMSSLIFCDKYGTDSIDESCWTDVEFVRSAKEFGGPYIVTKTLAEKEALDIAKELGVDLVSIAPTWVTGPFICPYLPYTVHISMALINGDAKHFTHIKDTSLVHVDDVARAHIHLFEYVEAKGRYICAAVESTADELHAFISKRYPEYQLPDADSWKDIVPVKFSGASTKKLLDTGFKYYNGLVEMFDGAIECCKEKGFM